MTSTHESFVRVPAAAPGAPPPPCLQPLPEQVGRCLEHLRRRASELGNDAVTLEELTSLSGLTHERLSREFRRSLGLRPLEVALLFRLERSLSLLEHTGLPVAEIAALCGFRGAPHYLKVFWFAFSMSPLDYREAAARGRAERLRSVAMRALYMHPAPSSKLDHDRRAVARSASHGEPAQLTR